MIDTQIFGSELKKLGYNFYSGVPCSFLKNLINYAINECDYVMASNEGDAVAIASGAALGGNKAVALMQNSGLTNAVSPLTSLNPIFELPVLGFVSLRGEPGIKDEPQHSLMGPITPDLLELMQVKWAYLSDDQETALAQLVEANTHVENNETFFFVVKKDTFKGVELQTKEVKSTPSGYVREENPCSPAEIPTRLNALEGLVDACGDSTLLLATTGKTGRELYEVADKPNHLYMVGSMGCISSLALGLSIAQPKCKAVAIDGDGSLLMRMGAMPTAAYYKPKNMLHILLDNNVHDSTGGQKTVSDHVDFCATARACGFPEVFFADSLDSFLSFYKNWQQNPSLSFLYLRTQPGSKKGLGRPEVSPAEVKERLMSFIKNQI